MPESVFARADVFICVFLRQQVTFVVDQGGGSFTAFLFGPGAKQLQKFKSYDVRRVGSE